MPPKNPKPSPGMKWLDKVSDLFADVDKNLDQVKKSVQDDLKSLRRKSGEELAVNFFMTAEEGFKKDLSEIGITGDAQKEYLDSFKKNWERMEVGSKSSEILNSPELAAMNEFIGSMENLPKLKGIIDSAKPQAKWEAMLNSFLPGFDKYKDQLAPLLSSIGLGFLLKKKSEKKDEKDKKVENPYEKRKEDEEKGNESQEKEIKAQDVPKDYKSDKRICCVGDSNVWGVASENLGLKEAINCTRTKAKGAMQSAWFLGKMGVRIPKPGEEVSETQEVNFAKHAEVNDEFLKDIDAISIGFGSNDIGEAKLSAKDIYNRLLLITLALKKLKPGIRIYLATIPPGENANWNANLGGHEKADAKRREVNDYIIKAGEKGLVHEVIRLDKKQSEGGVADNNDPSKLHADYLTYSSKQAKESGKPIDKVHLNPEFYSHQIRIAQYRDDQKTKDA